MVKICFATSSSDMSSRVQKIMAHKIIGLHLFVCSFTCHFALKTVAAANMWTQEGFASLCLLLAFVAKCQLGIA